MSIETAEWALHQRVDDPESKLILLALAVRSERGVCVATWREDVGFTGIDAADYERNLRLLAASGLVQVTIDPRREDFHVRFPVF